MNKNKLKEIKQRFAGYRHLLLGTVEVDFQSLITSEEECQKIVGDIQLVLSLLSTQFVKDSIAQIKEVKSAGNLNLAIKILQQILGIKPVEVSHD